MCGIHLIIDKKKQLHSGPIEKMLLQSINRGPDASNFLEINFEKYRVFIANNRLKINDLSDNANMPFVSEHGNYIISFNGEIYNHHDLRSELKAKFQFQTSSDTETLLYWLIEKGINGIGQLNGMFSFIFIDKNKETIWIARDKMGMKPLYKFQNDDFEIFSSEIKPILASGLVEKKFNPLQIPYYLQFRFTKPPHTFFENIFEFDKGMMSEYHRGRWVEKKIPDFYIQNQNKSLEEILMASVQRHIKSDVTAGIFLSGGMDSTLLLALASEVGDKNIPCFTISNNNLTKDVHYAIIAAKKYGGDINIIDFDDNSLSDFQHFITKVDHPIADPGAWLTYKLSEAAHKKGIKMILSGAGADELFGGYNRHEAFKKYLKFYSLINANLNWLKKIPFTKRLRLFQKFISNISLNKKQTFTNFTSLLPVFERNSQPIDDTIHEKDVLKWALEYDQNNYLPQDILKMTDQMAMQNSLEVRMPFLDQELINYTQNLSGNYILKNKKKWLLKKILTDKGGHIFTTRKKEGLGFSFADNLFKPELRETLLLLQNPKSLIYNYISFSNIQNILYDHKSKKTDYNSEIFAIATLALWIEINFN